MTAQKFLKELKKDKGYTVESAKKIRDLKRMVRKKGQVGRDAIFGSREHMLYMLHATYRFLLDLPSTCSDGTQIKPRRKRLNVKEEYELGRNLAKYWDIIK